MILNREGCPVLSARAVGSENLGYRNLQFSGKRPMKTWGEWWTAPHLPFEDGLRLWSINGVI